MQYLMSRIFFLAAESNKIEIQIKKTFLAAATHSGNVLDIWEEIWMQKISQNI